MRNYARYVIASSALFLSLWGGTSVWADDQVENQLSLVGDLSGKKIGSVGEPLNSVETGKWYMILNDRDTGGGHNGSFTQVMDNGAGAGITRAKRDADAVPQAGDVLIRYGIGNSLLRLEDGSMEKKEEQPPYLIQFATGNYWCDVTNFGNGKQLTTVANKDDAGTFSVYHLSAITPDNFFGINGYTGSTAYGNAINNDGDGNGVVVWSSGEDTSNQDGNSEWRIVAVTLEDATEEEIATAQAANLRDDNIATLTQLIADSYASYYDNSYIKLITDVYQLSSPYTETNEGQGLQALIDGDPTTYWHSTYHDGSHPNGQEYIQVTLPDGFKGGEVTLSITRRVSGASNNHITNMRVVDVTGNEEDTNVAEGAFSVDLVLPYNGNGTTETATFTLPEGVTCIRLYEEGTNSSAVGSGNEGIWHAAELQLLSATNSPNSLHRAATAAFLEAIGVAEATLGENGDNSAIVAGIEALQTAFDLYTEALEGAPEVYEVLPSITHICPMTGEGEWTLSNADSGSLTFSEEGVGTISKGEGETLSDNTVSHEQLTELEEGLYVVSINASATVDGEGGVTEGTILFKANGKSADLSTASEDSTYTLPATVSEDGTLDISFSLSDTNAKSLTFSGLTVVYLGRNGDTLLPLEGKMNTEKAQAMAEAITAFNDNKGSASKAEAVAKAVLAAQASLDYYATLTALIDRVKLDEEGTQAWEASEAYKAYAEGTLDGEDTVATALAEAQKAQTKDGADLTYALENEGVWSSENDEKTIVEGKHIAYVSEGTFTAENEPLTCTLEGLKAGRYELTFSAGVYTYSTDQKQEVKAREAVQEGDEEEETPQAQAEAYADEMTTPLAVVEYNEEATDAPSFTFVVNLTGEDNTLKFGIKMLEAAGNLAMVSPTSLTLVYAPNAEVNEAYAQALAEATSVAADTRLPEDAKDALEEVIAENTLDLGSADITNEVIEAATNALAEATTVAKQAIAKVRTDYAQALAEAANVAADTQLPAIAKDAFDEVIAANTLDVENEDIANEAFETATEVLATATGVAKQAIAYVRTTYTDALATAEATLADETDEAVATIMARIIEENTLPLDDDAENEIVKATAAELLSAAQALAEMEATAKAEAEANAQAEEEARQHQAIVAAYNEALRDAYDMLATLQEELGSAAMETELAEAVATYGRYGESDTDDVLVTATQALREAISTATGIGAVQNDEGAQQRIYTIDGVRVSKATKGLYIINGKKVLVK